MRKQKALLSLMKKIHKTCWISIVFIFSYSFLFAEPVLKDAKDGQVAVTAANNPDGTKNLERRGMKRASNDPNAEFDIDSQGTWSGGIKAMEDGLE